MLFIARCKCIAARYGWFRRIRVNVNIMKLVRLVMTAIMLLSLLIQASAMAHSCPEHEKHNAANAGDPQHHSQSLHQDVEQRECHSSAKVQQLADTEIDEGVSEPCHCPQHGCSQAPSVIAGVCSPQFVTPAEKIESLSLFHSPLLISPLYRPPA